MTNPGSRRHLPPNPLARRNAYTLVELLAAITVILLLATLVFGLLTFVIRKAAIAKAHHQMELLSLKLADYSAEKGGIPERKDADGLIVYTMLFGDGVGDDQKAGTGDDTLLDCVPDEGARVYLAELDPHANSLGLIAMHRGSDVPLRLVDPFGNPWRFRSGPEQNAVNPDFDLWSAGPDGREDTDDDIRNW